ncbi:hypothetical protein ACIGXI_36820 [Kitasatospora aureofaciens]|uniref:hypothetical protein n=1 Tax=Kitasatospora aureofaciens TaxID=1894 RepID=UPI0037C59D4E
MTAPACEHTCTGGAVTPGTTAVKAAPDSAPDSAPTVVRRPVPDHSVNAQCAPSTLSRTAGAVIACSAVPRSVQRGRFVPGASPGPASSSRPSGSTTRSPAAHALAPSPASPAPGTPTAVRARSSQRGWSQRHSSVSGWQADQLQ